MKNFRMILATLALVVGTMTAEARPMSYAAMRNNARFLTDRMAYTLGLSPALIDDLYYINYDYICGVNDYLDDVALGYYYADYMAVVRERDYALRRLLTLAQWNMLVTYDYFYRPISFVDRAWRFGIYAYDHRHNHFYCRVPRHYDTYRGGNHFHGMRPAHHKGPDRPHGPGFKVDRNGANDRLGGGKGHDTSRPGNDDRPDKGKGDSARPNNGGGRPTGSPNVDNKDNRPAGSGSSVRPGSGNGSGKRGESVRSSSRGGNANRDGGNTRAGSRSGRR